MYHRRRRGSKKFQAMAKASIKAREVKRLEGQAPTYTRDLPVVRRRLIIEDYDFGGVVRHEFVLFRCPRIDCYQVSVDGHVITEKMGWSRVLEMARKAFIRVGNFK